MGNENNSCVKWEVKDLNVWLTYVHESVLSFSMRWAKGAAPPGRVLFLSGGSGGEGVAKDAGMTLQFLPREEYPRVMTVSSHHLNFFLLCLIHWS